MDVSDNLVGGWSVATAPENQQERLVHIGWIVGFVETDEPHRASAVARILRDHTPAFS